jgi:hypothetical protein
MAMVEWCLLIKDKFIKLILDGKKIWEIRTQKLFKTGERIALGSTKTKNIEAYATIAEIKKMTVPEMKKHNDKHYANDFIDKLWKDREKLYAFVFSDVKRNPNPKPYPPSTGNPKVKLTRATSHEN